MARKEATRRVRQHGRVNGRQTTESITEFERGSQLFAILMAVAFGLMFFVGLM